MRLGLGLAGRKENKDKTQYDLILEADLNWSSEKRGNLLVGKRVFVGDESSYPGKKWG